MAEYLDALYQDQMVSRSLRIDSQQAKILREHGSELVWQRFANGVKRSEDILLRPPSADKWILIEDSADCIVVEIPVDEGRSRFSDRVPFIRPRLVLKLIEQRWQICDILRPCIRCNSSPSARPSVAGDCMFCDGEGILIDEPCRYCQGDGKCPKCKGQTFAGWKRVTQLT